MWRPDPDDEVPSVPRWLVPWVYPVGMVVAGVVVLAIILATR
jgi:hypothetical protein